MTTPITPELISPGIAAKRYGVSKRTLRNLEKRDPDFPPVIRLTRAIVRLRVADMDAYFQRKQQAATPAKDGQ